MSCVVWVEPMHVVRIAWLLKCCTGFALPIFLGFSSQRALVSGCCEIVFRASTIRMSQQAIALAMSSKSYVEEKEVRRERRAGSWHIARL
jgi:hypothetical protein